MQAKHFIAVGAVLTVAGLSALLVFTCVDGHHYVAAGIAIGLGLFIWINALLVEAEVSLCPMPTMPPPPPDVRQFNGMERV